MKKVLLIISAILPISANAEIYNNTNFQPYIGIDAGINIADYTTKTDLEDISYSATINTGARIGRNFGVELFFSHSSTNNLEHIDDFYAQNHEIYYMSFGFDIFGYYTVSKNFDFFTTSSSFAYSICCVLLLVFYVYIKLLYKS